MFVCSDMWEPYLKVIREKCSEALHILDRFHVVAKMNKALDEVRAAESRKMAQDGYQPLLKKSRWCVLKRKENLTAPTYIGNERACQIPVGQWMNANETSNRFDKCAPSAFTPNVSVA